MRYSLRSAVPAVLALMLVLAACGGSAASQSQADQGGGASQDPAGASASADSGGSSGGGGDLCSAATLEEVAEITGADVVDSTSADLSGVLSCNYNTADGTPVAGTTLTTGGVDGVIDPQAMFDGYLDATDAEEIPGLGDGAVMTGSDEFPILAVMVDGHMYSLSVLADNLDGPGKREATIELARLTIDRLP